MKELCSVIYVAALGVASHFIGNALPREWFNPARFPYKSFAWEKNGGVYHKLAVSKWKNRVPDMSKICGDMRPKTVRADMSEADITALIAETCVAECVHWLLIALSAGILLICPNAFGVAFWLADILLFNLPYIVIQRYNRPKILRLQASMRRRQA